MPLGASLGAVTLGERLFLTLRYRHALFDGTAAGEFMETFREALAGPGTATTRT
jgi:pyruvate/2-oxoglutarate dehydrogenase complex dihydrolipoamide acyltransferase (E2) component